ncbi:TonB-dependent receptor [soil metagenome]
MTRFLSPLLFLVLLAATPTALAQQEEVLPDLTPREFVIRGDATVSLPTIERQPLSGFGPPPRTYVIPAERNPAVAPYGQDFAQLPPAPMAAPRDPALAEADARFVRLDVLAGRYASRRVGLDAFAPIGRAALFVELDYEDLDRFRPSIPGGADTISTPYDALTYRAGFRTRGPYRFGVSAAGFADTYSLIGERFVFSTATAPFDRRGRGTSFEAFASGEAATALPFELGVRYETTRYDLSHRTLAADAAPELSDGRLGVRGRIELFQRRVVADGEFTSLNTGVATGPDLQTYSGGGAFRIEFGSGMFELGARALGYTASDANGGGFSNVVAPIVRFELSPSPGLRLFANTDGRVKPRNYRDLYLENPYASLSPVLAPQLVQADGRAGFAVQRELLAFRAYGLGTLSPVHQYWSRQEDGLFRPEYTTARILGGGAEATISELGGASLTAGFEFRDAMLTELGARVPYYAPIVASAAVRAPFLNNRLNLGAAARYEASRPRSLDGSDTVGGFALLSADASFELIRYASVLLRGERLLGSAEQWEGFPRPPFTVMAGLRLSY